MARQLLGEKKVQRLRNETGLPIYRVLVRGGTDHRRDLCLDDGSVIHMHRDGTLENSDVRWRQNIEQGPQPARAEEPTWQPSKTV